MNKYRVLIILLLTVCLGTSVRQAKAYGNSIITVNCPVITVSATSDNPLTYAAVGRNYIIGNLKNYTADRNPLYVIAPISSEPVVTAVGSTYIRYHYELRWDATKFLSAGDRFSFQMLDHTGYVGKIEGTCTGSTITSNSTPPSGYRPMTIMCSSNVLSSPGGQFFPLRLGASLSTARLKLASSVMSYLLAQ